MESTDKTTTRRSAIKTFLTSFIAFFAGSLGLARANLDTKENIINRNVPGGNVEIDKPPLFSSSVTHNGLVYVAGKGYHQEGDITKHTTEVLNALEEELEKAGSSMEHVLKVNVYLADLADYDKMNEAYRGRFGNNPPVRTTVATYGGVPGNSLVEIDCIAALIEA